MPLTYPKWLAALANNNMVINQPAGELYSCDKAYEVSSSAVSTTTTAPDTGCW